MKIELDPEIIQDLNEAVKCVKNGGIILYPTDTVWGLGCDATNSEAVKRIFRLKKREDSKSMLVLVNNEAALERIVDDIPEVAYDLIEVTEKPLTIIYDNAKGVAPELLASDGSLGIRITSETFSKELCKRCNVPIVSTSANISGEVSPSFFSEISDEIKGGVDYVVKYRQDDKQKKEPSHIIKLGRSGLVKVIR